MDRSHPSACATILPPHHTAGPVGPCPSNQDADRSSAHARALSDAGVHVDHVRLEGHIDAPFARTRLLRSSLASERRAIAALDPAFATACRA